MLDLGLGGTTAPGLKRLLARRVGGSVSVRDVEAEGLADVHLGTHERRDDCLYKLYLTYLNYDHRIHAMIYTTNWIERLQKDFRRVTRMRGAMPNEESVPSADGKDGHG